MNAAAELLIDPHEPEALRALGTVDAQIERRWGADFAILRGDQLALAVQRKTVSDLLGSRADGRLYRQVRLLQQVPASVVVIEGHPRWAADGFWADWHGHGPWWRREDWWTALDIVQAAGVRLLEVTDQAELASWLQYQRQQQR